MELETVRTALLITLSILFLVLVFRWYRDKVRANELPAPSHAELIALEVAYHPARLHVHLHMHAGRKLGTVLLDGSHQVIHRWDEEVVNAGDHHLLRQLPELRAGTYYLEVATSTQRIVRQFRLQPA